MVKRCVVLGCQWTTSHKENRRRCFSIPAISKKKYAKDLETLIKRRQLWLQRVNLKEKDTSEQTCVCEIHFVQGKPSYYLDTTHPDWAPSVKLGNLVEVNSVMERNYRRVSYNTKRSEFLNKLFVTKPDKDEKSYSSNEKRNSIHEETVMLNDVPASGEEEDTGPLDLTLTKTDMLVEQSDSNDNANVSVESSDSLIIASLREEVLQLTIELEALKKSNISLKKEFMEHINRPITSDFFDRCRNSDKWMRVYTSLTTAMSFEILFEAVSPAIIEHGNCVLSRREQLFLTLVKLTHNLSDVDLAFRFQISQPTVSRYFHTWIEAIYNRLKEHVLIWPTLDELKVAMPMCFRKHYPNTVSIIDCFETQIQVPNNPNDQAATYSTYKSRNTVKYLISSTPQGTVNFISKGFTGRSSDQYVVRNSGYLERLQPGDQVLADKGFDVAADIGLKGAVLITPAYKKGPQLTQLETETSRKVSNVRIHIEREIGCLRMRFDIMTGPVLMASFNNFGENICFYDKIVHVCCIIANLNPSIVPFE